MTQATDTELRDLILGLDKKIDGLDKKIDIFQVRTEEQLKTLSSQIEDLKKTDDEIKAQLKSQDNRIWAFITALVFSLVGLLAKLTFFSQN